MVKTIKCSDVDPDCSWSASADTEEELFAKIKTHAKEHHGFDEIPPELVEKTKANIKDQ